MCCSERSAICLEILIAILLPPLGVFLRHGCCSVRNSSKSLLFLFLFGRWSLTSSFSKKKKIHWPPLFPYSLLSLSCSWSSASAWCWLFWATCLGSSMPSMSSWQLILRNTVVITGSLFMDSHIASLMVWIKTWTFQGLSQLVKLLKKKKQNRTELVGMVLCCLYYIVSLFQDLFLFHFLFLFFYFFWLCYCTFTGHQILITVNILARLIIRLVTS